LEYSPAAPSRLAPDDVPVASFPGPPGGSGAGPAPGSMIHAGGRLDAARAPGRPTGSRPRPGPQPEAGHSLRLLRLATCVTRRIASGRGGRNFELEDCPRPRCPGRCHWPPSPIVRILPKCLARRYIKLRATSHLLVCAVADGGHLGRAHVVAHAVHIWRDRRRSARRQVWS
jgi:hypothetical protein